MKKGSYGRSKLVGHSTVNRTWKFTATTGSFIDPSSIVVFYVNSDNTNITTISDIGSPLLFIPINQLKQEVNIGTYSYDITQIIKTYGSGCYFFAWLDTSGQIQDNQLLISYNSGTINENCLIFTPAIETYWRNGPQNNLINLIRGVYIKNPSLPVNLDYIGEVNELRLNYGNANK